MIGVALMLAFVVILLIVLGLRGLFAKPEVPGIPLSVTKVSPTPFTSPLPIPGCGTVVSSDNVETTMSLPISLTLGGQSFPVVPDAPEDGRWSYPEERAGSAVWACTVVNYVLGLEPVAENEALLEELRPGDEIRLHLSDGVVLLFHFTDRRDVEANDPSVFDQSQPRLTLVLPGDDEWQVATAQYADTLETVEPPPGTMAQPGQPVRVGDVQVTVTSGHAEPGAPGLAPETMYYLVEFTVQNVGADPVDADAFTTRLQDEVGNTYLPSPPAAAFGNSDPLSGTIAPGTTVQGSIGYLVPETLPGPCLVWTFKPLPGSALQARVRIPFEGGTAGPPQVGQAEVSVSDAFLDDDVLIIEGQVRNVGSELLTVEQGDIRLTSSAGTGELRMAAPPLPWLVEPGQTQIIELQYDKPAASTALLSLAGYSFEIAGLE